MDLSIVTPAYKEAENLAVLLPKMNEHLSKTGYNYEILVINTQTDMDNTAEICEKNNAVNVYRENGNLYGDAIRTGFARANGRMIAVMDCDGSHDPADVVKMAKVMEEGADLVIGSRYVKNGRTNNNVILRAMSSLVNFAYRVIFKLKVKDLSNSFRVYKADLVKPIPLTCDNFDLVEEVLIRLVINTPEMVIKEHPIVFNKREFGESKRNLIKFIFSYLTTIRKLLKIKKQAQNQQRG